MEGKPSMVGAARAEQSRPAPADGLKASPEGRRPLVANPYKPTLPTEITFNSTPLPSTRPTQEPHQASSGRNVVRSITRATEAAAIAAAGILVPAATVSHAQVQEELNNRPTIGSTLEAVGLSRDNGQSNEESQVAGAAAAIPVDAIPEESSEELTAAGPLLDGEGTLVAEVLTAPVPTTITRADIPPMLSGVSRAGWTREQQAAFLQDGDNVRDWIIKMKSVADRAQNPQLNDAFDYFIRATASEFDPKPDYALTFGPQQRFMLLANPSFAVTALGESGAATTFSFNSTPEALLYGMKFDAGNIDYQNAGGFKVNDPEKSTFPYYGFVRDMSLARHGEELLTALSPDISSLSPQDLAQKLNSPSIRFWLELKSYEDLAKGYGELSSTLHNLGFADSAGSLRVVAQAWKDFQNTKMSPEEKARAWVRFIRDRNSSFSQIPVGDLANYLGTPEEVYAYLHTVLFPAGK